MKKTLFKKTDVISTEAFADEIARPLINGYNKFKKNFTALGRKQLRVSEYLESFKTFAPLSKISVPVPSGFKGNILDYLKDNTDLLTTLPNEVVSLQQELRIILANINNSKARLIASSDIIALKESADTLSAQSYSLQELYFGGPVSKDSAKLGDILSSTIELTNFLDLTTKESTVLAQDDFAKTIEDIADKAEELNNEASIAKSLISDIYTDDVKEDILTSLGDCMFAVGVTLSELSRVTYNQGVLAQIANKIFKDILKASDK